MQGKFSISISSTIDFVEDFDEIFSVRATNLINKGQIIGKQQSMYNRWIYSEPFTEDSFSLLFESFILKFVRFSEKIEDVTKKYDIQINIYIQSDMGQIGYVVTAKTLELLAILKLDISFHILSFGLVTD